MTTTRTVKVALVQSSCTGDIESNIAKSEAAIEQAANQGAQLILLQELHNSLYFCQSENTRFFDLAETIPGPSTERFAELAKRYQVIIVLSLFEKRAAGLFHNTAVVLDTDGQIAGKYRKMHIPDDPGFYEKFYFAPGDLGFEPIETSLGKLGVLVCWDQWFPEAARLMRLAGAEILLYPTAIGWNPDDDQNEKNRQIDAWQTIQRSHAIANHLPVVSCNRVGVENSIDNQEDTIQFWGHSFICGAQGEILAQAPNNKECILVTDIDLHAGHEISRIWPYLRDRRIDAYDGLTKLYRDEA